MTGTAPPMAALLAATRTALSPASGYDNADAYGYRKLVSALYENIEHTDTTKHHGDRSLGRHLQSCWARGKPALAAPAPARSGVPAAPLGAVGA